MELGILDRLVLAGMLDTYTGNPVNIGILSKVKDNLLISEEEMDKFGIVVDDRIGNVSWDRNIPNEVEIHISNRAKRLIADQLEKLGREDKLTLDHASLCAKFIGEDENEEE